MGRKDTVTKEYVRENAVFADAFNFFLYNGEPVLDPAGLTELDTTELVVPFSDNEAKDGFQTTEAVQKYRDILKSATIMRDDCASYVILGIENQSHIHYAMPVRNQIYDALQYGKQVTDLAGRHRAEKNERQDANWDRQPTKDEFLSGMHRDDRLTPVITLVIHFGAGEWDGPLSLKEMMEVSDETILSYIQDYKVNLIDPSQIAESDMNKFHSSLREVFNYIRYSTDGAKLKEYLESESRLQNLEVRAARVIKTITNSKFEIPEGTEVIDMCKAEEELMMESKNEGLAQGREEGAVQQAQATAIRMSQKGCTIEDISDFIGYQIDVVRGWLEFADCHGAVTP